MGEGIVYGSLKIDTYFDKVFYINLPEDTARNQHMVQQLDLAGITNYERIEATKLTTAPDKILYRNFIKDEWKYIIGSLSCRASHITCVKLAKERGYKRILIFEDDIKFLLYPDYLLNQNIGILNDWDMLYFSGLIESVFRNQIVGAYAYAVRNTVFDEILCMAEPSGMEIDNFYAKILHHMSYNHNQSGKYNVRIILPFNQVIHEQQFESNIQAGN